MVESHGAKVKIREILIPVDCDLMRSWDSEILEGVVGVESSSGEDLTIERSEGIDRIEDHLFDLGGRKIRVFGHDHGDHPGDVGRGHGGSAVTGIAVSGHRAVNARSGCCQVDSGCPVA